MKIHPPPQVLREKTQASALSEVSGPCKSVFVFFQPFIHDGSVSLSTDTSNSIPIKILTGTGASQSLLLSDPLVFSEKSSTCASVLISNLEAGERHHIQENRYGQSVTPGIKKQAVNTIMEAVITVIRMC